MKATKALKRLAKIEALLADVKARYSAKASDLRRLLQEAAAIVARAREVVSSQETAQVDRGTKKRTPAVKKVVAKTASARGARKRSAKRKAVATTASASSAATETAGIGDSIGDAGGSIKTDSSQTH